MGRHQSTIDNPKTTCKYRPICKYAKYGQLCNKLDCQWWAGGKLKFNNFYRGVKP